MSASSATAQFVRFPFRLVENGSRRVARLASNPVLIRDARALFRGRRVIALQLGYIVLLCLVMGIAAYARYASYAWQSSVGDPGYGRWIFIGIMETQVALLLLASVAYSAGAISLEHEKRTYDMLAITVLSSAEVVFGKIASVTLLCWMLLLTSVPLASFSLTLGGVSPGEIALAYGMLAIKIPLWAAIGVLVSAMLRRSIGSQFVAFTAVGAEFIISIFLSSPLPVGGGMDSHGIFNPTFAAGAGEIDFNFLGAGIPPWLLPIPYAVLLTGLAGVAAAEAMAHHRPRRSALLRTLLLATTFFMTALLAPIAVMATGALPTAGTRGYPGAPGQAIPPAVIAGVLLWIYVCMLVPVFSSYPPTRRAAGPRENPLAALLRPDRWLLREAGAAPGYCLLVWVAGLAGIFLVFGLAGFGGIVPTARILSLLDLAPVVLAVFGLSIFAYAFVGAACAVLSGMRRESAIVTALLILALNSCALIYGAGAGVLRTVPRHPALVLSSPAAAVYAFVSGGSRNARWGRFGESDAVLYGLGYSALLIVVALTYFLWRRRPQPTLGDSPGEIAPPPLPPEAAAADASGYATEEQ